MSHRISSSVKSYGKISKMRKMNIGWSKSGVILKEVAAARPAPAVAVKTEAMVTAMVIDVMISAVTRKSLL